MFLHDITSYGNKSCGWVKNHQCQTKPRILTSLKLCQQNFLSALWHTLEPSNKKEVSVLIDATVGIISLEAVNEYRLQELMQVSVPRLELAVNSMSHWIFQLVEPLSVHQASQVWLPAWRIILYSFSDELFCLSFPSLCFVIQWIL